MWQVNLKIKNRNGSKIFNRNISVKATDLIEAVNNVDILFSGFVYEAYNFRKLT